MKILFAFILILSTFAVSAQSKVINLDSLKKPKTEVELQKNSMPTDITYIYKAKKYPAYQSVTGKTFIIVQSPTSGNWYRKYIKQD